MRLQIFRETAFIVTDRNIAVMLKNACVVLKKNCNHGLSVAIVKKSTMRALNKKWRGLDRPANVLTFADRDLKKSRKNDPLFVLPEKKNKFLGEIIICGPMVTEQAKKNGNTVIEQFNHLLVHGFLHLWGHEHKNSSARHKMEKLEDKILKINNDMDRKAICR